MPVGQGRAVRPAFLGSELCTDLAGREFHVHLLVPRLCVVPCLAHHEELKVGGSNWLAGAVGALDDGELGRLTVWTCSPA